MTLSRYTTYSVLMSVYRKENPLYLHQSMESIFNQTAKTDDFVLVCDGELNEELYGVIDDFKNRYGSILNVVELQDNMGIGYAANIGLKNCKNELIAKMDSDDISHPDRCEIQLAAFNENPEVTIIGTDINEFEEHIDNVVSIRHLPTRHEDIRLFAKRRSPFNNQTIMFKKKDIVSIGGYSSLTRCEDYELFVRIINAGFITMNINKPLVYYRLTLDSFKRRATFRNAIDFISVRWQIHKIGYSSFFDFLIPCLVHLFLLIMPIKMRKRFYSRYLRENPKNVIITKEGTIALK